MECSFGNVFINGTKICSKIPGKISAENTIERWPIHKRATTRFSHVYRTEYQ